MCVCACVWLCVPVSVCVDVSCVCNSGYVGDGGFCNGAVINVLAMNKDFSRFYKVGGLR